MEYKFSTASKNCMLCKHQYEDLEFFVSALLSAKKKENADTNNDENDGFFMSEFHRLDLCLDCWDKQIKERYFSWWQMQKAPKPKLPVLKDIEFLWQLFYQAKSILEDAETVYPEDKITEAEHFAYISALGLMRMKQLKHSAYENDDEGHEFLIFTQSGTKNRVVVKDPKINAVMLSKLEEKMEKLSEERFSEE